MERERITLTIEVDLDPVPGMFHTAESARDVIQDFLNWNVGHYKPKVSLPEEEKKPEVEEVRTCEAMYWYAENYGVQCILPWGHELEGLEDHDFERK